MSGCYFIEARVGVLDNVVALFPIHLAISWEISLGTRNEIKQTKNKILFRKESPLSMISKQRARFPQPDWFSSAKLLVSPPPKEL